MASNTERLAVAYIPSDQDRNLGAIAGYTEAGGCRILAHQAAQIAIAKGLTAHYFEPGLESEDDADHARLRVAFAEARLWLDRQTARGLVTCCVHVHTNAGPSPEAGSSHTGYCHSTELPGGMGLGVAICERLSAALGLPVQAYDYTGWLFDLLLRPHPSVLIEVTRHDREADLGRLYEARDAVATGLVDGPLAWAGITAAAEELAALRRTNAELEAALARYRTFARGVADLLRTAEVAL